MRCIRSLLAVCVSIVLIIFVAACSGGGTETAAVPLPSAGPDQAVATGSIVTLDGSASGPVAYHWSFHSLPEHSAATLSDPADAKATFTADEDGMYVLNLAVSDGEVRGQTDRVIIRADRRIHRLDYLVTDAEFSKTMDEIVIVSTTGNRLHIYDPLTQVDRSLDLPLPPACVSVSPDGLFAAIGHDRLISYVDLEAGALLKTLPVAIAVYEIVLAGNGFVYAIPGHGLRESIRSIEIDTEAESTGPMHSSIPMMRAKVHPNGTSIYGVSNKVNPSDVVKYDISGGTARFVYDSPYHGHHRMHDDLWISGDGLRIITKAATTFRASEIRDDDMTYVGSLGDLTGAVYADHSTAADQIVAISGNDTSEMLIYDAMSLVFKRSRPLPNFSLHHPSRGRYVFYSGDGSRIFAIIRANADLELEFDFGVVSY